MSNNFTGVTFPRQKVTPLDDALIRRQILLDGVLQGCELSYAGSTLTMEAGQLIACGRQFRHPSVQNWPVVDATSGFARLLLTLDLTRAASIEAFDQIVDTIEYAGSEDGFPSLIQEDINYRGSKYQIVVCVVSLGAGGITGIVSQLGHSGPVNTGMSISLLWENASPTSGFAAQTVNVNWKDYDVITITAYGFYSGASVVLSTSANQEANGEHFWGHLHWGFVEGGVMYHADRHVLLTSGGIEFGNCVINSTEQTGRLVPYKIYGIKGVIS